MKDGGAYEGRENMEQGTIRRLSPFIATGQILFYVYDLMIRYKAKMKKFGQQGEKTGWTYIELSQDKAQQLLPGNKKSFRVKGKLDELLISKVALLPMGDGSFIMPLKSGVRRQLKKQCGDTLDVALEVDSQAIQPPSDFIECLNDEPKAREHFDSLSRSHQNYFTNYINAAKTDPTKAKRIAESINALAKGWHFGEMMRAKKVNR